ncbi:MAG: penicillin-binding protein 2, partial [Bifidobacteriaceae bacterium]|nr:penicillin-binding protein 2 [Bifidobacteriaceae bacterium]
TSETFEAGSQTYVSSFVGLLPAEAPRLAVGVFFMAPKRHYYGAEVAGPVFEKLAAAAVDRLGVPPSTTPAEQLPLEW